MTAHNTRTGLRRVVAGVDGSQASLDALLWAADDAQAREVPLTVLHAFDLPESIVEPFEPEQVAAPFEPPGGFTEPRVDGRDIVRSGAAMAKERHPDLAVETELSPLHPAQSLIEAGAQDSLVVTGTRGHGGFVGMLLGSVSRALAMHTIGPLVVVRGEHATRATGPVVLGVGQEPAEAATWFAFEAAQRYGTPLHAVRALHPETEIPPPVAGTALPGIMPLGVGIPGQPLGDAPPYTRSGGIDDDAEVSQALAAVRAHFPDVKVESTAVEGDPATLLTEHSADARLVVVGAHHRRGPITLGPGRIIESLLSHSPAPVAVVPAELSSANGTYET